MEGRDESLNLLSRPRAHQPVHRGRLAAVRSSRLGQAARGRGLRRDRDPVAVRGADHAGHTGRIHQRDPLDAEWAGRARAFPAAPTTTRSRPDEYAEHIARVEADRGDPGHRVAQRRVRCVVAHVFPHRRTGRRRRAGIEPVRDGHRPERAGDGRRARAHATPSAS